MGSNCVSCVEYHIPESRKAGLSDLEIHAAIRLADEVRQVPARKTLQAALNMLPPAAGDAENVGARQGCGCGAEKEAGNAAQPMDHMGGMMSRLMTACGGVAQSAGDPSASAKRPTANSPTNEGRACA
jgi:4-carboxymuconolactone decarboxylase